MDKSKVYPGNKNEYQFMNAADRYKNLINYLTDYKYTVIIKDGAPIETVHGPGCVSVTGYNSEDYQKDPDLWSRMVHKKDKEEGLKQA